MIDKVLGVVFWIFVILTVILVLWKVFGSSPLIDQVIAALAPALFVEFLRIERKLVRHEVQIKNLEQQMEKGFSELKALITERR